MSDARIPTETPVHVSASDRHSPSELARKELRAEVAGDYPHDFGDHQRHYFCVQCHKACINPRGSVLSRAGVCLPCHVDYLMGVRR